MKTGRLFISVSVALLLAAGALPASAAGEPVPASEDAEGHGVLVSEDVTGDANFVNGRGWLEGMDAGPDTRPASIDGADLERIWFSTSHETTKILRADGSVDKVIYGPKAFRVTIQTHGDVLPTSGHNLYFGVPATATPPNGSSETCRLVFQAWIRDTEAVDPPVFTPHPHRADIHRPHTWDNPCDVPGISESYTLSVAGNLIVMEYPLDVLGVAMIEGSRLRAPAPGTWDNWYPTSRASWPGPWGNTASFPAQPTIIDEAPPISAFDVGEDVPPDVACSEQPAHPDCQA